MILGFDYTAGDFFVTLGVGLAGLASGWAIHRRKDEVQVSGQIHTKEMSDVVTVERMTLTLRNHPTKDDLSVVEDRLGEKIDEKFTLLDGKRSSDIRDLHRDLAVTQQNVAALKQLGETHTQMLTGIDQKVSSRR